MHEATAEELRAAIAAVTRALANPADRDTVLDLVRERAAMRRELQALGEGEGASRVHNESHSPKPCQTFATGPRRSDLRKLRLCGNSAG